MRTVRHISLLLLPLILLAGPPAATASRGAPATSIATPGEGAVLPPGQVRIRVRLAAGVRTYRALLDGRDVTRGLRRRGAAVEGAATVKPGLHRLTIHARDAAGRNRSASRRFLAARRSDALVAVTAPRAAAGVLRLRIKAAPRTDAVRVSVNGHRSRTYDLHGRVSALTVRLGVGHGVRFGRNTVRVLAFRERDARYQRVTRVVRVRRSRPLLPAIARRTVARRPLTLDARSVRRTRRGARLRYHWHIVRRPRGSKVRVVPGAAARPRLRPDRPGRYLLRMSVTESKHGRRRHAATLAEVNARPNLQPIGARVQTATTLPSGVPGISIDGVGTFATPNVGSAYLLGLDATTLEPLGGLKEIPLNSSFDSSLGPALGALAGQDALAILVSRRCCTGGSPQSSLVDTSGPFAYIFRPTKSGDHGIRSGYSTSGRDTFQGASPAGNLTGYLQRGFAVGSTGAGDFTFVPGEYIPFDTFSESLRADINGFEVGGQVYPMELDHGQNGFAVLIMSPRLYPEETEGYGTNTGTAADAQSLDRMAALLNAYRTRDPGYLVMIQTVGAPRPTGDTRAQWEAVASEIERLGGSRALFLGLCGRRPGPETGEYAFVTTTGSPGATSEASACLPSSPSDPEGHPGELSGALHRNRLFQLEPMAAGVDGDEVADLFEVAYQPRQEWPQTDTAGKRDALAYIATRLNLGAASCYQPAQPDVRSSYCNVTGIEWVAKRQDLFDQSTVPPQDPSGRYKFSPAEFTAVRGQLSDEFEALATVNQHMKEVKGDLGGDVIAGYMQLADMATQIRTAVPHPEQRQIASEVVGVVGEAFKLASVFGGEGAVKPALEAIGALLGISGDITTLATGEPAAIQPIEVDTGGLSRALEDRYEAAGYAIARIWDLFVSDWGKLSTAQRRMENGWGLTGEEIDEQAAVVRLGAKRWIAQKVMGATYDVWMLPVSPRPNETPQNDLYCNYPGYFQKTFKPFDGEAPDAVYAPQDHLGGDGTPFADTFWTLANGNVWDKDRRALFPPQAMMGQLFGSVKDGGLGFYRPSFFEPTFPVKHGSPDFSITCTWFTGG